MASICELLIHRGFTSAVIVSVMVEEKRKPAAGEKQGRKPWTLREFGGKTLWDWLNLLIVPLGVAFFAGLFTIAQAIYQQSAEERLQQTIVDFTSKTQRNIEDQRAQDATLQAYLDAMETLIVEHHLRNSKADSEVRTLAQARTTTTVERLDGYRKGQVLQFLAEAKLIERADERNAVISLREVDLGEVDARSIDLSGADLSGADLSGADLSGADLRGAYLRGAVLRDAVLSNAYLKDATITEEQLEQAESLKGATMPNGQKYEDWLKSKDQEEN
jgi:uncharacterized protein YjbI with pentapeptide repeats